MVHSPYSKYTTVLVMIQCSKYLSTEDLQNEAWISVSFFVSINCERCIITKSVAVITAKNKKNMPFVGQIKVKISSKCHHWKT